MWIMSGSHVERMRIFASLCDRNGTYVESVYMKHQSKAKRANKVIRVRDKAEKNRANILKRFMDIGID